MTTYRSFADVSREYFRTRPEEVSDFLSEIFSNYAQDRDLGTLLSGIRIIVQAKDMAAIASELGLNIQDLQQTLSNPDVLRFDQLNAIMWTLGYVLAPRKL